VQTPSCDHVAWRARLFPYSNPLAPRLRPHPARTLAAASVVPDPPGHALLAQDGRSPTRASVGTAISIPSDRRKRAARSRDRPTIHLAGRGHMLRHNTDIRARKSVSLDR
jgi:hypothetical protein